MKKHLLSAALAVGMLAATAASAAPIVLTFEGAGNQASLNGFYGGGTDSLGNAGSNYGITFGSNALSIIDQDAGGSGNIANEPSGKTVMFFLTGSAVLNYAAGFDTGFSFFYSSSTAATIKIYDDINATGNLIASIDLAAQFGANGCSGDPTGSFCNWTAVGASFAGIAKSIDFGGTVNQTAYDDITIGSATAGDTGGKVPEPASLPLVALAMAGAVVGVRRRNTKQ